MKASTIKHILPQVIPKLEYKHYPLALVLDTINGLANTSQHSDTYRINGLRYFVRMA